MNIANVVQREVSLFDLDGTLVDSATDLHRAMNMSPNAAAYLLLLKRRCESGLGRERRCFVKYLAAFNRVKLIPPSKQQLFGYVLKFIMPTVCGTQPFGWHS